MKTHCPRGHAMTPDNLVRYKKNTHRRECRECKAERSKSQRARAKLMRRPRPEPVANLSEMTGPLTRAQLQAERAASAERRRIKDEAERAKYQRERVLFPSVWTKRKKMDAHEEWAA